jgi:hypothetical protein
VQQEIQDQQDLLDILAKLGQPVQLDRRVPRVHWDNWAQLAWLDRLVEQASLEILELRVLLDWLDQKELLVQLDWLDKLDLLDNRDLQAMLELLVCLVLLDFREQ